MHWASSVMIIPYGPQLCAWYIEQMLREDIKLGGPWSTCGSTENLAVLLILLMIFFMKLNNLLSLPELFDLWPFLSPAQLAAVLYLNISNLSAWRN